MTRLEVMKRMRQDGLLKFTRLGVEVKYVNGQDYYYDKCFHAEPNTFGVYYNDYYGRYIFFIVGDDSKGIKNYHSKHIIEDEAYSEMYKFVLNQLYL